MTTIPFYRRTRYVSVTRELALTHGAVWRHLSFQAPCGTGWTLARHYRLMAEDGQGPGLEGVGDVADAGAGVHDDIDRLRADRLLACGSAAAAGDLGIASCTLEYGDGRAGEVRDVDDAGPDVDCDSQR